jgi:hypothetical protein
MIWVALGWIVCGIIGLLVFRLATKAGYSTAGATCWVVGLGVLNGLASGMLTYGHSLT